MAVTLHLGGVEKNGYKKIVENYRLSGQFLNHINFDAFTQNMNNICIVV